jgi:isoleucyl-tRNA synthetase
MSQYKEVSRFDQPALEEDVLAWWKANNVFERSVSEREGAPAFTFYEGPPTANGQPGIHHVMARAIKDIFCRYQTMKGRRVARKAGWDTHGLPVEIEVEKELDLEGREEILDYGLDRYNDACRESVLRYKDQWDELTERMGYWVDLDDPYVTFETEYIETVWWLLKQIYEKDLLYKGHKIQWYSPGSGTVLSSHEVSLGYEEVQDPSVYVRFPVSGEDDTFFLAWTTTPWTLISNAALAVGPDLDYVKVRLTSDSERGHGRAGEQLILADERVEEVLLNEYEVVERYSGRELIGAEYTPLYAYFEDANGTENAWCVVEADFVSTEDGTGVVHMAPAFGAEDFEVGQREDLPLFNPIDEDGHFTEEAPLVNGLWFKDADGKIWRDLRDRGLLLRHETYLHNYPHDWRKGTPLMSYPVESWFIRTTAIKERMMELNDQINWQPSAIGSGRFGEWLEGNVDWALSRRRYWGTPLPIWESDDPDSDYVEMIGSVEELREKCGAQLPDDDADIDLHRPYVDELTWPAPDGEATMRRVPDLIDVWFDSGAMPFAQWHYPFENEEAFARNFPADFIAEGVDQTRGWFYTLHAIAALVMNDKAYENVVVNGLVLDADGEKMSKSEGNAVEPFETIREYGADVVRWYMMSNTPPWENIKFAERGLNETRRKFFGTLQNSYSFFATYANIDGFAYDESERVPPSEREELDQWILSRFHSTTATVDEAFADYDPTKAARAVEDFVEELSNWYIRRSRRRFWAAKGNEGAVERESEREEAANRKSEIGNRRSKEFAYQTVYECLRGAAKLMAPIAPFFGEWLYRALSGDDVSKDSASVHLADFPAREGQVVQPELEHRMQLARTVCTITHGLRNQDQINVRQPLPRILVVTGAGVQKDSVRRVEGIIRDEVNVKDVEYVASSSEVVERSAKPDFARLGSRLGELMQPVNQKVRALGDDEIERYLNEGEMTLQVNGETVELGPDDLIIESEGLEGWSVGQEQGLTVALDTTISEELRREGQAREVVSRIQSLRKESGFDVADRIRIEYSAEGDLADAIERHAGWIRNETLALEFDATPAPKGEGVATYTVSDHEVTLGVRRMEDGRRQTAHERREASD